jgi:hypothetical protein
MTPEETQALGKALDTAKDYADEVLKGPLAEFGGILSDTIGYWRLKNRVRLMLKAKQWLEEKGVEPRKVLPEVFVPLLEDGGNVEDETLASMFASLLASHLDPAQEENIHPSYTKVLAQLSPLDAKLMLVFRRGASYQGAREIGLRGWVLSVEDVAKMEDVSKRAGYLSCLNLWRLGIVEHQGYRPPSGHPIPTVFEDSPEHQQYRITEYGIAFCDTCQYKEGEQQA